jgi:hypothetical protein
VLTVIVTITGRSMCNVSRYCDNNDNNGKVYKQFLAVIVTKTGRYMWSTICNAIN